MRHLTDLWTLRFIFNAWEYQTTPLQGVIPETPRVLSTSVGKIGGCEGTGYDTVVP